MKEYLRHQKQQSKKCLERQKEQLQQQKRYIQQHIRRQKQVLPEQKVWLEEQNFCNNPLYNQCNYRRAVAASYHLKIWTPSWRFYCKQECIPGVVDAYRPQQWPSGGSARGRLPGGGVCRGVSAQGVSDQGGYLLRGVSDHGGCLPGGGF